MNHLLMKIHYVSAIKIHMFFGYYDISPFSEDGKILLSQKTEIDNRPPKSDDILKIDIID